ncbi:MULTISPECIES: type II toxin-antitoxin system ParD family antitoxin [unclassified Sphingomonas]|uniref:type II toxin-antitoxin system ParD family antitoxin n=1 Tax=unclassified Sphingomonas TaxID=196159 RepID=UPI0009E963B1|nr:MULTISPECIES: type II toxin-antitoxin system ParD family antitoxin [unclassified Sphingomonas]
MPTPTRNIALTTELDAFIKAQVLSGRYSSSSEVVRSALRLLMNEADARFQESQTHVR